MKRKIALLLPVIHIVFVLSACTETKTGKIASSRVYPYWLKTYNSRIQENQIDSIRKTADGGYVAAGKIAYQDNNSFKYEFKAGILKLDAGGNIEWQHGFGDSVDAYGFYIAQQTDDGGYFAMGRKDVSDLRNLQTLLVKLDANGALQWQQTFPGYLAGSYAQAVNGDYVLTGSTWALDNEETFVVVRLRYDGECRWQKVYGRGAGRVIRQASDGGFIALATSWVGTELDSFIVKLDPSGIIQKEIQYQGRLNVMEPVAGGFLLAGATYGRLTGRVAGSPQAKSVQGWLLMLDHDCTVKWQKLYGGVFMDAFTDMRKTSDGNLIVLGNTYSYGAGNGDLWLLKITEKGALLWQRTIGGSGVETANDIELSSDGGYVIAAKTRSLTTRGSGLPMILKVDKDGGQPETTLPLFHPSNAIADDDEDNRMEAGQRRYSMPGKDVVPLLKKSALTAYALSIVAASFWPPEPKISVSQKEVSVKLFRNNPSNMNSLRPLEIRNIGGADLTISKTTITEEKLSGNGFLFYLGQIWKKISRKPPSYIFESACTTLKPGSGCFNNKLSVNSLSAAKGRATITIHSNDPDNPVINIPVTIKVY